jgi:hypothetical protein
MIYVITATAILVAVYYHGRSVMYKENSEMWEADVKRLREFNTQLLDKLKSDK